MPAPARLYRYRACNPRNLEALEKSQVWFSSPTSFNDPYDCAYDIALGEVTMADIEAVMSLASGGRISPAHLAKFDAAALKSAIITGLQESVNRAVGAVQGVCCFSEVNDDLLMWGHYCDCHKGFCLEFDTSDDELFSNVHPVRYSNDIPKLSVNAFTKLAFDEVMSLLLTKAQCWFYEKEWRVLHRHAGFAFQYRPTSLVGVYFGARMPNEQMDEIASRLRGTAAKFYKMGISKTQFKLEASPITI